MAATEITEVASWFALAISTFRTNLSTILTQGL